MLAASLLLGLLVGLLLALTGAGGGVLSVPLLVFVLHLSIAEAAPIALLAVLLAAGLGAVLGLRAGIVRYKMAALLALSGILVAPLGLWLGQRLPNVLLTVVFSSVLSFVAIRMLRQSHLEDDALAWLDERQPPPCELDKQRGKLRWTAPCTRSIIFSGVLAGFFSGLLGVGGGFVIVPALRGITDLDAKSIVSTSLAAISLVSAGGVLMAAAHGLLNWGHAWPFATGAAIGMLAGGRLSRFWSGPKFQQSFAVFALLISLGLVLRLLA